MFGIFSEIVLTHGEIIHVVNCEIFCNCKM